MRTCSCENRWNISGISQIKATQDRQSKQALTRIQLSRLRWLNQTSFIEKGRSSRCLFPSWNSISSSTHQISQMKTERSCSQQLIFEAQQLNGLNPIFKTECKRHLKNINQKLIRCSIDSLLLWLKWSRTLETSTKSERPSILLWQSAKGPLLPPTPLNSNKLQHTWVIGQIDHSWSTTTRGWRTKLRKD